MANVTVNNHNSPNKRLLNFFVISLKLYHICDKVKSVMMKYDGILDDIELLKALWIGDSIKDDADLARVADAAIGMSVPFVSMPAGAVGTFWPWIEDRNIKILARINFEIDAEPEKADNEISAFSKYLTATFRKGASGAQVFVPYAHVAQFVDAIYPIRNDLFFDRYLSIGLDVDKTDNTDWSDVFEKIMKIKPDAILLFGRTEKFNPNTNFVGGIFSMLENWNPGPDLHLMFGKNMLRVSQVLRLTEKMRPEILKNLRVFVEQ